MICFLREWGTLKNYSVSIPGARPGRVSGLACNPDRSWATESLRATVRGKAEDFDIASIRDIDDRHKTLALDPEATRPDTHRLTDIATLIGCEVIGQDGGSAGSVTDLLINVHSWEVRYLIIRNESKCFLLAPQWIHSTEIDENHIMVDLPVAALLQAPRYSGMHDLSRGYEESLYRHYTNRVYCRTAVA